MFNTLRRQLTIFNMLMILFLLIAISLLVYLGSPRNSAPTIDSSFWEIAYTGNLPKQQRHQPGFARLLYYGEGQSLEIASQLQLDDSTYQQIAHRIVASREIQGSLTHADGKEYLFLSLAAFATDESTPVSDASMQIIASDSTRSPQRIIVIQPLSSRWQSFVSFISGALLIILMAVFLTALASLGISARALRPIRAAWQRQIDFTADASHELRNPLAVIQSNLEVVLDNPEKTVESQRRWLENIRRESHRMNRLVADLLSLARADSEQEIQQPELFSLSELCQERFEALQVQAEQQQLNLQAEIATGIDIRGNYEQLQRLLVILFDNALKHTPSGGLVCICLNANEQEAQLKVSDDGEGIAAEHLPFIFERFYRADQARSRERGGSGLGLAIAKAIVQQHQGHIEVASELRQGSHFTVTLPLHS